MEKTKLEDFDKYFYQEEVWKFNATNETSTHYKQSKP